MKSTPGDGDESDVNLHDAADEEAMPRHECLPGRSYSRKGLGGKRINNQNACRTYMQVAGEHAS